MTLETVQDCVCQAAGLSPEALLAGGRRLVQSRVREGIAYLWSEWLGHSGRPLAYLLGVRPESVHKAARREWVHASRWQGVLGSIAPSKTKSH